MIRPNRIRCYRWPVISPRRPFVIYDRRNLRIGELRAERGHLRRITDAGNDFAREPMQHNPDVHVCILAVHDRIVG
jgi:hypothetical protein